MNIQYFKKYRDYIAEKTLEFINNENNEIIITPEVLVDNNDN